ncbi:SMP-30/gluconolactonase/LRE family protein [Leptospira sarikeiensis]|uniref:SMP-30/gluconolactonase/LRE family protein n=1 Tax=Leptospira sarikeiensis TaxID=2484943 RepID=A0A4R9KCH7_9LEPT|nr:SMP-30/gluconolactonase/LRE family protein [Leptospira sarikeiensis]TGL62812.1 SMP-30/gluconolactonase/LRE family protein [Leptospira sarikeiensis]
MFKAIYSNPTLRIILPFLSIVLVFGSFLFFGWNKTDPTDYIADEPIHQNEKDILFLSNSINEKSPILKPYGLAIDSKGSVYTGSADGNIYKIKTDGKVELFAETSGVPIGLVFDGKENLVSCVSGLGLAFYDTKGNENVLLREDSEGNPLTNLYGLDISSDGTVYFTQVSKKFDYEESYLEELESIPNGRILSYDPRTQEVKTVLDDLYHPTGISLSSTEDFLLFGEKYRHRVSRLWLKGKKTGRDQFFITHLPGSPSLISSDFQRNFWITLSSPRHPAIDKIQNFPIIKRIIASLPSFFRPKEGELAFVFAMDENGDIVYSLADYSSSKLGSITAAIPYGSGLILAGFSSHKIWKWKFESLEIFF